MGFAPYAGADVLVPFVPAYFSTQDNGAIALFGNSQMSCPASTACTAARTATPGTSAVNNNNFVMQFLDLDSDAATSNSTSADIALPAGSTVLSALLVWGARRTGTLPTGGSGTIALATAQRIDLRTPGSTGYTTYTGGIDNPAGTDGNAYQGYLDVTSQVRAAGGGTYWVGNMAGTVGADRYAGWSIIVAYRNPAAPLRDLQIFRGFAEVADTAVTIPISGFLTPAAGTVSSAVGFVAFEGDRTTTGDGMPSSTVRH